LTGAQAGKSRVPAGKEDETAVKVAVTGKGGVGKTTFSALLCHLYETENVGVLAVDADPDANLAVTLGFSRDETPDPISSLRELIHERTGAQPGTWGGMFKINPKVDDIPDKYCVRRGTLSLMIMGTVESGGKGCICPESAFLKALMAHMVFNEDQHLVMDMEAGLEHLGRGTATAVDSFVVVVRPDIKSIETAERIMPLCADLNIKNVFFVGNEIRDDSDEAFLREKLADYNVAGMIPASDEVRNSGRESRPPFGDQAVIEAVRGIRKRLETGAAG